MASRFRSGGSTFQALGTSPSPPSGLSPELNALTPSSNGNATTSPALDAESETSFVPSIPQNANDWSKGTSMGLASSPRNLISLAGESPPTQPSSYEDPRGLPNGWQSPRPHLIDHTASASASASASPPAFMARRPLSVQMETQYKALELPASLAHPAARRSSLHSHYAQSRGTPNPPLPHQPQAHFFTAPELDFDAHPQSGMRAGDRGYHFGFDDLPGLHGSGGKSTVVVAGYEGGLEVHSVAKGGLSHVAGLTGLRGGVRHAKILPGLGGEKQGTDLFPVIALVLHGPVLEPADVDDALAPGQLSPASGGGMPGSPRPGQRFGLGQDRVEDAQPPHVAFYQTSVELFSLKTNKRLVKLLEAPKTPVTMPFTSPLFKAPPPTGDLQIKAVAGTVMVSSGVTGECWIFQHEARTGRNDLHFHCLGKLWTTIPAPLKDDVAAAAAQDPSLQSIGSPPPRPSSQQPVVALNGRWIAYCPAAPSSQVALRANVLVPGLGKAPGLASLTPPQLPPVSADVDVPTEGMVNKLVRDAAQEAIKGAKWIGQQSVQAWKTYWGVPSQASSQPARSSPTVSQGFSGAHSPRQEHLQFPPTHGAPTHGAPAPAVHKEPGLISILAIDTLPSSATVHPIASFSAPLGCSYVSFSPTGLALFTANAKGDVQNVWDLMRIQYNKASMLQAGNSAPAESSIPRIRQIASYSRMTMTRIVDVSWTKPNGERLAMVTERGTVHLLDLPPSAFAWPPPRRRVKATARTTAPASEGPASSTISMATTALSSAIDAARPLLDRSRRSSGNNTSQVTTSGIVGQASHGSKAIAASISHSLGKTGSAINQLRHTGESRVSLPTVRLPPNPGCVVWIGGRKQQHLFIIGSGMVRTFPNRTRKSAATLEQLRTPHLTRYHDLRLAPLPDSAIAPAVREFLDAGGGGQMHLTEEDLDAGNANTLTLGPSVGPADEPGPDSSIPQAEIESSAPYQPFHTDRRVALYEYGSAEPPAAAAELPTVSVLLTEHASDRAKPSRTAAAPARVVPGGSAAIRGAWTFGQPIAALTIDLGLPPLPDDDSSSYSGLAGSRALPASAIERVLQHVGHNDEQIVVTTRRRRGAGRSGIAELEEDGFFEDDCEVLDFADQRV
jgi:hypothetical protein